jgi:U3 small nucleolar RNA-associated protein 25
MIRSTAKTRTILFIPSYFDLVRVKNYLKEHNYAHGVLSEYTTPQNISRARLSFFKAEIPLLLVTERFHFFKRYMLRGSVHVVFYAVPERADFYAEFANRAGEEQGIEEASVAVLYTRYDGLRLERVVGAEKAAVMCRGGGKEAFMFS